MPTIFRDVLSWMSVGIPAFILVIAVVIVIHELGHFLVGRACGVGVKCFSIGFGPEIFGWTDKKGTRWKVCWLPLGGYVMFEGDADAASVPDREAVAKMTEEQRARALPAKPLWQRALVSAAGPLANFVLAFVLYTLLYGVIGGTMLGTMVGEVSPKSPAAEAGILPGDRIVAINGKRITTFNPELIQAIKESNGATLAVSLNRAGRVIDLTVTPRDIDTKDIYGAKVRISRAIGVSPDAESPDNVIYVRVPLAKAPLAAAYQCWGIVDVSMTYLWRIVSHRADSSGLGGPVRIATVAKSAASHGLYDLLSLIAFISVSIGLINLFPIPVLDGGHLLYYACESVLGRPLSEAAQDAGFKLGLVLVLGLMIFATWNDIVRLLGSISAGHT